MNVPTWLADVAAISLTLSVISALILAVDIALGRRQKMLIMNFVWPISGLWAGPFAVWIYWKIARATPAHRSESKPLWQSVLIGDTHCGAGCTLGDFAGEWIVFLSGLTLAGSVLWADYAIDFALAFAFGIVFQYYSIAPMRGISGWAGIKAALKADTLSLLSFEVGMFLWMALSSKVLFQPRLEPSSATYWFMMQIAMWIGFLTAYPANWWLIRHRWKEQM